MGVPLCDEAVVPTLKRERFSGAPHAERHPKAHRRQPDFDELSKPDRCPITNKGSLPVAGSSCATEPRFGCIAIRNVPPPSRVSPRDQALARLAVMQRKFGGPLMGTTPRWVDARGMVLDFVNDVVNDFGLGKTRVEKWKLSGLAVTYFDTYLSKAEEHEREKALKDSDSILNLASVCILLMSKFTLTKTATLADLDDIAWDWACPRWTRERPCDLKAKLRRKQKKLEIKVLETLEWKLAIVSPFDALSQLFKVLELKRQPPSFAGVINKTYANVVWSVENAQVALKFAPVTIAASSFIAACNDLGHHRLWNDNFMRLRDICEVSSADLEKCVRLFAGPSFTHLTDQTEELDDLPSPPPAPCTVANADKVGRPPDWMPRHLMPFMEEEPDLNEAEEWQEVTLRRHPNVEIELEAYDVSLSSDEDEMMVSPPF